MMLAVRKSLHRRAKGAVAGNEEGIRLIHVGRDVGDPCIEPRPDQGAVEAVEIPGAVVNDGNHTSVPFVDGTS